LRRNLDKDELGEAVVRNGGQVGKRALKSRSSLPLGELTFFALHMSGIIATLL
jgi:hypothetical protein